MKKGSNIVSSTTSRAGIVGELFGFLWKRKLWWLIPMVAVLLVFGVLLIVASASPAIAPFIYTLFSDRNLSEQIRIFMKPVRDKG